MQKRSSAPARILAVLALIGGFILSVVLVSAALDSGDEDGGSKGGRNGQVTRRQSEKPTKKTPAKYEVEEGDTLTSIAQSTGVPVGQIERLNPGVDPQILNPGEELKLR